MGIDVNTVLRNMDNSGVFLENVKLPLTPRILSTLIDIYYTYKLRLDFIIKWVKSGNVKKVT